MPTLGEALKLKRPDKYASVTADALDSQAQKLMDDPTSKPLFLKNVRADLGTPDTVDDVSAERAVRSLIRPARAVSNMPAPEQMDAAKHGATKQRLGKEYTKNRQLQGSNSAPGMPPSEHVAGMIQNQQRENPTPQSAMSDDEGETPRWPVAENFADLEKIKAAHPKSHYEIPGAGLGFQVMLYEDGTNKPIASLHEKAAFDQSKVPGANILTRMIGTGSRLKQAEAMAAKRALPLVMRKEEADAVRALPDNAIGFREIGGAAGRAAGERDPRRHLALAAGTGAAIYPIMRGAQALDATEAAGNRLVQKGARAVGWDSLDKGLESWAKANEEDARKEGFNARDIEDLVAQQFHNDELPPEQLKEMGGTAGEWGGKEMGEWGDLLAPTEGSVVAGKVLGKVFGKPTVNGLAVGKSPAMRAAQAVIPKEAQVALRGGYRAAAEKAGRLQERIANSAANQPISQFFSDNPAKFGQRGEARIAGDLASQKVKNLASVEKEALGEEIGAAEQAILDKHGVPDSGVAPGSRRFLPKKINPRDDVIKSAASKMATEEGLRASTPVEQDLQKLWIEHSRKVFDASVESGARNAPVEKLQDLDWARKIAQGSGRHESLAEVDAAIKGAKEDLAAGKGVQWNPLHDLYGQNSLKRAQRLGSEMNRGTQNAGAPIHQGREIPTHAVADLPQFAGLSPEVKATMRIREPVPRAQKISQWEDIQRQVPWNERLPEREIAGRAKQARQMLPREAIPMAMEDVVQKSGRPQQEAAADMFRSMKRVGAKDPRFTNIEALEAAAGPTPHVRADAYNVPRKNGQPVARIPVEQALRDNGMVVLHAGGAPPKGAAVLDSKLVMQLPPHFGPEWEGKVVPRNWAEMAVGSTKPVSELTSTKAREIAKNLDRWLGLTQQKLTITRGNMGFDLRNRTNEVLRMLAEEGGAVLKKDLRKAAAEISNAPLGRPSGKMVRLGGRLYDTGELRTQLHMQGAVKSGFRSEATKELAEHAGSGRLLEKVGGKYLDKAADASRALGEAHGRASNDLFRRILDVDGMHLNKVYEAEDGLRILTVVSKLDKGQSLPTAVRDMKTLLIDYTDKNAIEAFGATIIPFIKYYTGAGEGALRIALNEPRAFSRAADFARAMETYDQTVHGGALDPRHKQLQDKLAMNPQIQFGRKLATVRNEAPSTELANMFAAISGQDEQGAAKYNSPLINQIRASMSGKDPVTDRSIYGFDKDQMKRAAPDMFSQWAQAHQDDAANGDQALLGRDPKLKLAYMLAHHMPLIGGRITTPQLDMLARAVADLGSSSAARLPEDSGDAMERSMFTAATGVRVPGLDPEASAARQLAESNKELPENPMKARGRRFRTGRTR